MKTVAIYYDNGTEPLLLEADNIDMDSGILVLMKDDPKSLMFINMKNVDYARVEEFKAETTN